MHLIKQPQCGRLTDSGCMITRPARVAGLLQTGLTHRPLSSFLLGLPYRILNINNTKELLRAYGQLQQLLGLWGVRSFRFPVCQAAEPCQVQCHQQPSPVVKDLCRQTFPEARITCNPNPTE